MKRFAATLLVALGLAAPAACGAPAGPPAAAHGAATALLGERLLAAERQASSSANVVISPFSIGAALTMLGQGARGKTADELDTALGYGAQKLSLADAAAAFAADRAAWTKAQHVTVDLANGLWSNRTTPLAPGFVQTLRTRFGAEAGVLDFSAPGAERPINAFVNQATHGQIPTLFDRLPARTGVVLVNAIYFKGDWQAPFDPTLTHPDDFTTAGGRVASVATMRQTRRFDYLETDALQAVSLPYGDGRFELVLMLMKHPGAPPPAGWIAGLGPDRFKPMQGTVAVPKLKLAWGEDILPVLSGLGFQKAFGDGADYSGMTPQPARIAAVEHRAVFRMDEKGVVAAAASGVVVQVTAMRRPGATFAFIANRPYYLLLRDRMSGAPLFVGYVADPSVAAG